MAENRGICLEIGDSAGQVVRRTFESQALCVGRSPESQIHLDRGTVSRRHAEFLRDPFHRWWVRDLGSRNGTRVNGQLVHESVIHPGDVVGIGEFNLRVVWLDDTGTASIDALVQTHSTAVVVEEKQESISSLREHEQPRIAAIHITVLSEFGRELAQTEDPQERLRSLCRLMIRPEFRGRCAMVIRIMRQDAGEGPHMLCPVETCSQWQGWTPYISRSLLRAIGQKDEPLMASNADSFVGRMAEISLSPDVMPIAAVACPIRSEESHVDALYVILPPEFGTGEWLALAALATKAYQQAESVWAARHQREIHAAVERELEQARQIQTRLLPRRLDIPGLDLAIGFLPCRWVGGDFADVVPAPDGRVLLVIADVCGKGLPAALVASSIHATIRVVIRAGMSLPEMMRNVGRHLLEYHTQQSFVTMVCVLIDPATGQVECVNAGHPPALLIGADGQVVALQSAANLPLGLVDEPLESQRHQVQPGQLLALYTDGLSELACSDGRQLGSEELIRRLQSLYQANATATAQQLGQKLTATLDQLQGSSLSQDDRTFLLARRVP